MKDTCHLYTELAWLWPMWGDAATEYAHYCQHVSGLSRKYAERPAATLLDIGCGGGKTVLNPICDHGRLRIETDHWTMGIFSLDVWRHVLRETGFDVHEGQYYPGEGAYTVFTCVKKG